MATEVERPKTEHPFFDNNGGLNTRGSLFKTVAGQARVARNCIFSKDGGFRARKGQAKTTTNPAPGAPDSIVSISFRRVVSGAITDKRMVYANDGAIYNHSVDPPASSLSGLTTSGVSPDFIVIHGFVIFCDGVNTPKKFDGTTWTQFGITKPAAAPTLALGGAGSPNGTYRFRVAFGRQTTGIDPGSISSMGTISGTISPVNQIINLSNIPVSADAQVNMRVIYVEIAGEWYEATTINDNVTTTYAYNALDSTTVNTGLPKGRTDRDPPPVTIIYMAVQDGIVFASDGKKLYWSIVDEFESFSQLRRASNAFNTDDGELISGLSPCSGDLAVCKQRSIYIRSGDDVDYTIEKRCDNGVLSHYSLVEFDKGIYYISHDAFRFFDGFNSQPISGNVDNLLYGTQAILHPASARRISGVSLATDQFKAIIWSLPSSGSESPYALVYFWEYETLDTSNPKRTATVGAWTLWDSLNARSFFVEIDSTTQRDRLFEAGNDGNVREMLAVYGDDGVAVNASYRPVDEYFDQPLHSKRLRDATFFIEMEAGIPPPGTPPVVSWYVDGITSGVAINLTFSALVSAATYDSAIYDLDHYAAEGTFHSTVNYGSNPFFTIAPEIAWSVSEAEEDILWLGWVLREMDAGVRPIRRT